ncbi:MAG: LPXTG cell wall anchor domain-containing protein [Bacteroidia bacterium]|nr:LPXTG cell wall anchor domain-containing protein [Bacteroidia bacterium]
MSILRHRLFILILFSFLFSPLWGQDISAKWIIEEGDPSLNEFLHLEKVRLEISHPKSSVVVWPQFKDSIGDFEILEAGKVDTTFDNGDLLTRSQNFMLIASGNGKMELPGVDIKSLSNDQELSHKVNGVLLDVATQAIDTTKGTKELKEIVDVPVTVGEWLPWVGIGLALIALIGGGIWYYRKRKNDEPIFAPSPPPVPAHEIAMRALAKLEEQKLWQNGYVKEYYVDLTNIIRAYIEKRFKVPAMESISDEILKDLKQEKLKPIMLKGLSDLLIRADLAKFAKSQPDSGENLASMEFARTFVKESKNMMTLWEEELKKQAENESVRKEETEL